MGLTVSVLALVWFDGHSTIDGELSIRNWVLSGFLFIQANK
jgi:hypothetical protein